MKEQAMFRELLGIAAKGLIGISASFGSLAIAYLSDVREILQIVALLAGIIVSSLTSVSLYKGLKEKKKRKH